MGDVSLWLLNRPAIDRLWGTAEYNPGKHLCFISSEVLRGMGAQKPPAYLLIRKPTRYGLIS